MQKDALYCMKVRIYWEKFTDSGQLKKKTSFVEIYRNLTYKNFKQMLWGTRLFIRDTNSVLINMTKASDSSRELSRIIYMDGPKPLQPAQRDEKLYFDVHE